MTTLLIVLVIFLLIGVPWGGWHSYGYGPAGFLGVVVAVLLVLILLGRVSL